MEIPIQNIFYIHVYAWKYISEANTIDLSSVPGNRLENLLSKVLISATEHLLKRGLDRGYVPITEETSTLRGRISFTESINKLSLQQGKAVCVYDDFTHNVLHNQIIKSTIRKLASVDTINKDLKHKLLSVYKRLDGVDKIQVNKLAFRKVQLHGNNSFYKFILKICELVHLNMLPTREKGADKFKDLFSDKKMSFIFEKFVANFFKIEQETYKVKPQGKVDWILDNETDTTYLPAMYPDIILRNNDKTIVIDTKYTAKSLLKHYISGKESADSKHLYQLFSYLKNLEGNGGNDAKAEGVLLYPAVEKNIDIEWDISGHRMRIVTINLAQDWTNIHRDILNIIGVEAETEQAAA